MRQGSALSISRNGLETLSTESFHLAAQLIEFAGSIVFGDSGLSLNAMFQPIEEAFHHHSVKQVSLAYVIDFKHILDSFSGSYGTLYRYDAGSDALAQFITYRIRIKANRQVKA